MRDLSADYACGRARELISLALDGELSELGRTRLAAHLDGCSACRDFEFQTRATAQALRASPLEQPSRQILLPRRGRVTALRAVQVGAVAAVLLVATAIGTLAPGSHVRRTNVVLSIRSANGSEQKELGIVRHLRLQQIKPVPVGLAGGVQ